MEVLKNILGRVLAFWAALLFIVTMFPMGLIVLILYLVKEPYRMIAFQKISRVWISIYLFLIGCRLKIFGKDNFKKGQAYVIICNHTSFMDILVTTPFFPGPSKTIAKSELAKIPLFGLIYKSGSVLVNRKDKNSRVNSFKEMKNVLALNLSMCIYPEGTRNKTNLPLKEFHNGAFKLAVETQTPILPAVIFNSKKAMPADKTFFVWPAKMEIHYLPAVQASSIDNYEILKKNLFEIMSKYFVAHNQS